MALLKDANNNPVPIQPLKASGGQSISVTSSSTKQTTAFTKKAISILSTTDCFVEIGGSSVTAATATSHFVLANERRDISLKSDGGSLLTYIAAIRSTADGTLYVSELDI